MEQIKALVEKLNAEWTAFKAENDRRLKEVAAKGSADPLTEEKINKHSTAIGELQAQLDAVQKQAARVAAGAPDEAAQKLASHRKAFSNFVRKGDESGVREFQAGLSVGSDTEGGYTVPVTLDKMIEEYERDNVPMRQLCNVITVSSEAFEKLVKQGGTSSGWVGESEARPETTAPTWAALSPYFGELYANVGATQKMLDDSMLDIEAFLANEYGLQFGEDENDAFTKGTGVKKPKGILGYTLSTSADGTRTFGQIQKVNSGSSGLFTFDNLIDLIQSLKRGYRNGAVFMMSNLGVSAARKLKDSNGDYIWQPGGQAGQPSSLLGYAVEENDDMPDPAADANAIVFGNLKRAYTIVDVRGTRILRDPYTNKPKVMFYATKRVGGFVVNDRAVKVLTLT